jgi:hypothetical protein
MYFSITKTFESYIVFSLPYYKTWLAHSQRDRALEKKNLGLDWLAHFFNKGYYIHKRVSNKGFMIDVHGF